MFPAIFANALLGSQGAQSTVIAATGGFPEIAFTYQNTSPYIPKVKQFIIDELPPGRNDKCPCGSGRKFKKCCMHATEKQP